MAVAVAWSQGHSHELENCIVPRQIRETRRLVPGSVMYSMVSDKVQACQVGTGTRGYEGPAIAYPSLGTASGPAARPGRTQLRAAACMLPLARPLAQRLPVRDS